MHRSDTVGRLDLDHHRVLNYYIHLVRRLDPEAFVTNRQPNLPFERNSRVPQLVTKTLLVG